VLILIVKLVSFTKILLLIETKGVIITRIVKLDEMSVVNKYYIDILTFLKEKKNVY